MKRYVWNKRSLVCVASVLMAVSSACTQAQESESEPDEDDEVGSAIQALIPGYSFSNGPGATAAPGTSVSINYVAPAGHSATDWVALHRVNAPYYEILSYRFVSADSGNVTLSLAGAVEGEAYEFQYFVNNTYVVAANSSSFTVQAAPIVYSLSNGPTMAFPGSVATIDWTAPASHSTYDWVGLFVAGTPGEEFVDFYYLDEAGTTSGTAEIMIPEDAAPGSSYEMRLYLDDFFDLAASAPSFTIGNGLFGPSEPVPPGTLISADWTAQTNHSTTDWIGLFLVGAPNNQPLTWSYVNAPGQGTGSVSMKLPASAPLTKKCELRYFSNNTYQKVGQSPSFFVENALSGVPDYLAPGATINVGWTGPSDHSTNDWIGLFEVGAAKNAIVDYKFVGSSGATSGNVAITLPASASLGAHYELRYHVGNTYDVSTTSESFVAGTAPPYAVDEPVGNVSPGQQLSIPWTAPIDHAASDWIALQLVGANPWEVASYSYVGSAGVASGQVSIKVPASAAPGSYELRYYVNNTYTVKAVSDAFGVN